MAVNMSVQVYLPVMNVFSVPCTIHPVYSQPKGESYRSRGYYGTSQTDVIAEDGSVYADQQTFFDIRTIEHPILPQQKDRIEIPYDAQGARLGMFEIVDTSLNGGGLLTMVIRRFEPQTPIRRELLKYGSIGGH